MTGKKAIIVFGGLLVLAIVVIYSWPPRLTGDGGFELIGAKLSPTGSTTAEVFAYRGGATVRGFSILVVRPANRTIPPEDFSARVADCEGSDPMKISWSADKLLTVSFPSTEHRILKRTAFGISIKESKAE